MLLLIIVLVLLFGGGGGYYGYNSYGYRWRFGTDHTCCTGYLVARWTWRLLRVSYLDSTSGTSLVFRVTIAGSEKSDRRLSRFKGGLKK